MTRLQKIFYDNLAGERLEVLSTPRSDRETSAFVERFTRMRRGMMIYQHRQSRSLILFINDRGHIYMATTQIDGLPALKDVTTSLIDTILSSPLDILVIYDIPSFRVEGIKYETYISSRSSSLGPDNALSSESGSDDALSHVTTSEEPGPRRLWDLEDVIGDLDFDFETPVEDILREDFQIGRGETFNDSSDDYLSELAALRETLDPEDQAFLDSLPIPTTAEEMQLLINRMRRRLLDEESESTSSSRDPYLDAMNDLRRTLGPNHEAFLDNIPTPTSPEEMQQVINRVKWYIKKNKLDKKGKGKKK
jgi:hypothetical protein